MDRQYKPFVSCKDLQTTVLLFYDFIHFYSKPRGDQFTALTHDISTRVNI